MRRWIWRLSASSRSRASVTRDSSLISLLACRWLLLPDLRILAQVQKIPADELLVVGWVLLPGHHRLHLRRKLGAQLCALHARATRPRQDLPVRRERRTVAQLALRREDLPGWPGIRG